MSGKSRGVAARIMELYLKALYTHCSSHVLNLCIVKSTNISHVRNMMDIADRVARFFNNSPKRQLAGIPSSTIPVNKVIINADKEKVPSVRRIWGTKKDVSISVIAKTLKQHTSVGNKVAIQ